MQSKWSQDQGVIWGIKAKDPLARKLENAKREEKILKKEQQIILKMKMTVCRYTERFNVQQRNKELILKY